MQYSKPLLPTETELRSMTPEALADLAKVLFRRRECLLAAIEDAAHGGIPSEAVCWCPVLTGKTWQALVDDADAEAEAIASLLDKIIALLEQQL